MPLDEGIPSVSAAHTSGADRPMKHLLDLGHRRVGQITGPRGWVATEDRRRGYRGCAGGAGILPDPTLEQEAEPEIAPAVQPPNSYSISPNRPPRSSRSTTTSQSARFKLLARWSTSPGTLSVVGFDDVEHATIRDACTHHWFASPCRDGSHRCVVWLMRPARRQRCETLHVELATRLVVRDSTAPPPRA